MTYSTKKLYLRILRYNNNQRNNMFTRKSFSFFVYYSCQVLIFFFFFQAEDGIRDGRVIGVQTCALPIFLVATTRPGRAGKRWSGCWRTASVRGRSEERRVGKSVDLGGRRIIKKKKN